MQALARSLTSTCNGGQACHRQAQMFSVCTVSWFSYPFGSLASNTSAVDFLEHISNAHSCGFGAGPRRDSVAVVHVV